MTQVKFLSGPGGINGFEISGHCSSDSDDETGRVVCAAVSSAAYMTANTITDVIGDKAEVQIDDALMRLCVKTPSSSASAVLEGLRLHLTELSGQYGDNIRIYGGAKHVKD